MISLLAFSVRVDEDSDVSRSNFKGWWTRLSGMYVFCKHLGAASTCGTDKSPASAMCFVTPPATASTCKTLEQAVERVVGEWLVLKCCDSIAVSVERVPLKSSVYMRNGWFSSSNDMCLERALVTCLKARARGD